MKKGRVITYGTFDLLHNGHINILKRAKEISEYLVVGLSTDDFNMLKGKQAFQNFEKRKEKLEQLGFIDEIIPENKWEQKAEDIRSKKIDAFVMGSDWKGKFDFLDKITEVIYLERTPGVSSTQIRNEIINQEVENLHKLVGEIQTKELDNKWDLSLCESKRIMTTGTFDFLHIGHKKIINHCIKITGSESNVIIAVTSDNLNEIKGKKPHQNEDVRVANIKKSYPKAKVIIEDNSNAWQRIWDEEELDMIIMGGDYKENLDYFNELKSLKGRPMRISFFERTPNISSSLIREKIKNSQDI